MPCRAAASQDPPQAAAPRAAATASTAHLIRGKLELVANYSGAGKQGGGELDGGAWRRCCQRRRPGGGRYFICRPEWTVNEIPPEPLPNVGSDLSLRSGSKALSVPPLSSRARAALANLLPAVVPFDEGLPECQRHPQASRRLRKLRGAGGDIVSFNAVRRPVALGAAVPSRAPPSSMSLRPISRRLVLTVRSNDIEEARRVYPAAARHTRTISSTSTRLHAPSRGLETAPPPRRPLGTVVSYGLVFSL